MALIEKLKAIGDAIRAKTGGTDELTLDQMVTEIDSIEAGGGSSGDDEKMAARIIEGAPVVLTNSLARSVKNNIFYDVDSLVEVDLPNATSIGNSAFSKCSNLDTVNLPSTENVDIYAFANCIALTSIFLPKATTIGNNAFSSCYNLTRIDLPMATSIGGDAICDCVSLENINLPMAETIEYGAFAGCSKLVSAVLPKATTFGDSVFSNCRSLTYLDFGSANSIPGGLFGSGIENLATIILRTTAQVCDFEVAIIVGTKIVSQEGVPTGEGFIYVPSTLFEDYVANFVMQITLVFGLDEATATYISTAILRKIEDYPEICGS